MIASFFYHYGANRNTQIFIGTTDYKTIEEFSKRCGNFSILQRSVGFNTVRADDVNSNTSVKERPLIYPSELQQLNSKGNMGNAIVTVFGYQPIRAKFTPSYASKFYDLRESRQILRTGRYFDENAAYYDMKKRNERIFVVKRAGKSGGGGLREQIAERRRRSAATEKLQTLIAKSLHGFATEQENSDIFVLVQSGEYDKVIGKLKELKTRAGGKSERGSAIQDAIDRVEEMKNGDIRLEIRE